MKNSMTLVLTNPLITMEGYKTYLPHEQSELDFTFIKNGLPILSGKFDYKGIYMQFTEEDKFTELLKEALDKNKTAKFYILVNEPYDLKNGILAGTINHLNTKLLSNFCYVDKTWFDRKDDSPTVYLCPSEDKNYSWLAGSFDVLDPKDYSFIHRVKVTWTIYNNHAQNNDKLKDFCVYLRQRFHHTSADSNIWNMCLNDAIVIKIPTGGDWGSAIKTTMKEQGFTKFVDRLTIPDAIKQPVGYKRYVCDLARVIMY